MSQILDRWTIENIARQLQIFVRQDKNLNSTYGCREQSIMWYNAYFKVLEGDVSKEIYWKLKVIALKEKINTR